MIGPSVLMPMRTASSALSLIFIPSMTWSVSSAKQTYCSACADGGMSGETSTPEHM
jgi:hypothetical protein